MNKAALADLHAAFGHKPLSRMWAKAEILLGLLAAGAGLLIGDWAVSQRPLEENLVTAALGLLLFVLGGYLALAGHRSHLYQSNNELTEFLAEEVRRSQKGQG